MRTFSFGGGVQSMAVLVLAAQKKVQYDYFLFSNVGEDSEYPGTLKYYREIAEPFAVQHNIPMIELHRIRRDGSVETLMGKINRLKSSLPIPVRMSNGAPGNRSCTADFKIAVISKWLKRNGATKSNPAVTGLGISLDEWDRARTDSGIPHQILEYPLIDMEITRQGCIKIIQAAGLPVPPKSSCYFCPFHSKNFWIEQKRNEPELFEKSVALENMLNERRASLGKDRIYLHRSLVPLELAVGDQPSLFDEHADACIGVSCMT